MNSDHILAADDSAGTLSQGHDSPSSRILVVDDDDAMRQLSAMVLTASGYQVDTVEDGVAGLEALYRTSYDLLITDNTMPEFRAWN